MPKKQPGRKQNRPSGKHQGQDADAVGRGPSTLKVRKLASGDGWELVHPRCARDRAEDLEEVRKMLDAGEIDVAIDECRWLLHGCSDCVAAHRILGEIALEENDLPLARGHFGYAFRLGTKALEQFKAPGPLPYAAEANQAFLESGKGLAWCLKRMEKRDLAAEVVAEMLRCDPTDPLGVRNLLNDAPPDGQPATA